MQGFLEWCDKCHKEMGLHNFHNERVKGSVVNLQIQQHLDKFDREFQFFPTGDWRRNKHQDVKQFLQQALQSTWNAAVKDTVEKAEKEIQVIEEPNLGLLSVGDSKVADRYADGVNDARSEIKRKWKRFDQNKLINKLE